MAGTYSTEAIEEAIWMHEHRHYVVEALRAIAYQNPYEGAGYETIKAVAELIGYDERIKRSR